METKYNLEERTVKFGKDVLKLCRSAKKNELSAPVINQLVRCATSVGANYFEANGASSKRDFKNKIHLCKKEVKESTYWLQIMEEFCSNREMLKTLKQEAHELLLIFSKIAASSK